MEGDQLMMMGAICVVVYLAGYKSLAVGLFIVMVAASLITPQAKKAAPYGGVTVQGAEMLEPIIIETTKGAPFRIPAKMQIRMNPYWGATPWREKIAKHLGRLTRWSADQAGMLEAPFEPRKG
jgi:hypothetical protein